MYKALSATNHIAQLFVGSILIIGCAGSLWLVGLVLKMIAHLLFRTGFLFVRFAFWLRNKEVPLPSDTLKGLFK